MAHFFASNYSQSYVYHGQVKSFSYILQKNNGDVQQTASETEAALVAHFSGYFTDVQADVTGSIDRDNPSKGTLSIVLNFKDSKGNSYDIQRVTELLDGKFSKIITINNG